MKPTTNPPEIAPHPFPERLTSTLRGIALVGFVLGMLLGIALTLEGFGGDSSSSPYFDSGPDGEMIGLGLAIVGGSIVHWALFHSFAVALAYLWTIQAELRLASR